MEKIETDFRYPLNIGHRVNKKLCWEIIAPIIWDNLNASTTNYYKLQITRSKWKK